MPLALRVAAVLPLLLAGAATGLSVVALHHRSWALVFGASASLLALMALPPGWWSRLPFCLGMVAVVGFAATSRPEGGYVVASTPRGYSVLGLGLVMVCLAVGTLPPARRAGRRESRHESGQTAHPA